MASLTWSIFQLYKGAGEDDIQLFDLSVIPKNHSSTGCHDSSRSLPSLISRGRSDAVYSLGTLLYRIAHRLSLSMVWNNETCFWADCALQISLNWLLIIVLFCFRLLKIGLGV